jgi:hypothetical protein
VIGVATVLYAGVWAAVILLPIPAVGILTITSLLYYMIVALIVLEHKSGSRPEVRPGGQPPRDPSSDAAGHASRSADPAGQSPPAVPRRQHTAEAAPSRLPRLPRPGTASRVRPSLGLIAGE